MKVCHIISGDLWAGAEVMAYRLLKGLLNYNNLELSAILFNEGRLAKVLRTLGIPLYVADEEKFNSFRLIGEIKKIVRKISPDVLHSHR